MYRLRYPVVSGSESGFAAASGAATDMSFIVGDNLPQRQAGVGSYILIRHWKGRMSGSQRSKSTRRSKKTDDTLEGRTTAASSSARLDGSQGKLSAEKTGKAKRASFAQEKQFAGPSREAGRK